MANTFPSQNPADDGTLTGLMKLAVRKAAQDMNVMMPVEVISYDRASNRAVVKHMVQMRASDGQAVSRAQIASIRVQQFGNAKFSVSLPIKPGDKGWLVAADRDISVFQQDIATENPPNTDRAHSFEDGVFMPDAMGAGDVPAGEGDRVVIGSVSGGAIWSLDDDGVYITVGGVKVEITAAGVAITGGLVTHDARNIGSTHVHTLVTPGTEESGPPPL